MALLPDGLFARLVQRTRRQPAAFTGQLRQLFAAMATGGWFGADQILHFNGGLFDDATVLELDRGRRLDILDRVVAADWSAIEPSIFGTLFERGLDPGKRSQLGAHFTSHEDILLLIEPVLMTPLRRRWDETHGQAEALAGRRDEAEAKNTPTSTNSLRGCWSFLAGTRRVRVLNRPAAAATSSTWRCSRCWTLWKEVYNLMLTLGLTTCGYPGHGAVAGADLGIEINEYAHELAQATIWIGYIQWLRNNGFGHPPEPILQSIQTVRRMDAILERGEREQTGERERRERGGRA